MADPGQDQLALELNFKMVFKVREHDGEDECDRHIYLYFIKRNS